MTASSLHYAPTQSAEQVLHLATEAGSPSSRSPRSAAIHDAGLRGASVRDGQHVRSWPLLILALPAAVAVWSGWVGIGQMTGFGQVHPLPGLWASLHLNTAITLPIGVEAYAAYALRAWLSANTALSARTRRFARHSAVGSLLLGMAGQVAYHLLTQSHTAHAPWPVTMAVSCLPVLVLGMGAALTHLLHSDTHRLMAQATVRSADHTKDRLRDHSPGKDHGGTTIQPDRLAAAEAAVARLHAAGQRVSRRALRAAGVHASNAELGALAITLKAHPSSPQQDPAGRPPRPTPA